MARFSFTREQREIAKRDGLALVHFGYDDRHLTKARGGKWGAMDSFGPEDSAIIPELLKLLTKYAKKRNKRHAAGAKP